MFFDFFKKKTPKPSDDTTGHAEVVASPLSDVAPGAEPIDSTDAVSEVVAEPVASSDERTIAQLPEPAVEQMPVEPVQAQAEEIIAEPAEVFAQTSAQEFAEPAPSVQVALEETIPVPSQENAQAFSQESVEPKLGFFARIKRGLTRTSNHFAEGLGNLFLGRKTIDEDLFEELETQLLVADVGMEATSEIIDNLTARVARKQLADSDALFNALREQLADLLRPVEQPLVIDRIRRSNQFASESIGYDVAEGYNIEQARAAIEAKAIEILMPKEVYLAPHGASGPGWGPSTPSMGGNPAMLIACVLLAVYLILGILYESTIHPLTILSTLPSAGIGALLALQLTETPFSLIAMLGLFLLIGIVMKNAILMIDFALELERRDGLSPQESIYQAALMRFRPILMTNLAGVLGALPLILGFNEGSELRAPLGITIIGGLVMSQLLTLFTTPVVYLYMERLRQWGLRG